MTVVGRCSVLAKAESRIREKAEAVSELVLGERRHPTEPEAMIPLWHSSHLQYQAQQAAGERRGYRTDTLPSSNLHGSSSAYAHHQAHTQVAPSLAAPAAPPRHLSRTAPAGQRQYGQRQLEQLRRCERAPAFHTHPLPMLPI